MEIVRQIVIGIKDALFPVFCLGCGREGTWLCPDCFQSIGSSGVHGCPLCHRFTAAGECCDDCAPASALASQRAVVAYREDTLIGEIIRTFKYQYITELIGLIQKLITPYLVRHRRAFAAIDLIMPVPLHPRRWAERGFNQAELIARSLSETLGKPVSRALLARGRYTQSQARLNKEQRQHNIQGAFQWRAEASLADKNVLLVDDVFTTGSTLQECARVLRAAGACQVSGFTVARG